MTVHDWRAMASFHLTESQASAASAGSTVTLGMENLSKDPPILIGCFVCELPFAEGRGKPCSGEPKGVLTYVQGRGQS